MAVNITPKKRINHDDDKCNRMFGVLAKMVIVEILSYHGLLIPESHLFKATLDWRLDFSHPDSQLWCEVHSELMQRISGHNNQWYEQWTCWKQSFFPGNNTDDYDSWPPPVFHVLKSTHQAAKTSHSLKFPQHEAYIHRALVWGRWRFWTCQLCVSHSVTKVVCVFGSELFGTGPRSSKYIDLLFFSVTYFTRNKCTLSPFVMQRFALGWDGGNSFQRTNLVWRQ